MSALIAAAATVLMRGLSTYGGGITSPDGQIVVDTCDYDGGAICSLTFGGQQFIDNFDHGRQLQSAVSFDGLGEALNPTEGGSVNDGTNPRRSTSYRVSEDTTGNVLSTSSLMAYWTPYNGAALSSIYFTKRVQFIKPHVMQYDVSYTIPAGEQHTAATFESLTGYMPAVFRDFYTLDLNDVKAGVVRLSDGPGEQSVPVIFSTTDQAYAMGIWSPKLPQPEWIGAGYGRWRFPWQNVVKWNAVYRIANPVGTYSFRSYVFVGSLASVMADMKELASKLPK